MGSQLRVRVLSLSWWALASSLLLTACGAEQEDITRVVVIVDADDAVKSQASDLVLVVHDLTEGRERLVHDDTDAPGKRTFPRRIALVPKGNDPARTYRFEARAVADRQIVAVARLISGYVARQTRYVRIVLDEACIGQECSADETCHAGDCVPAEHPATSFAKEEARAPLNTSLPGTATDAAAGPEDELDAGSAELDAQTPASDAGQAEGDAAAQALMGTDAALGDATTPLHDGSAPDSGRDALSGPDAAAPADAGACAGPNPYACYKQAPASESYCPQQYPGNTMPSCAGNDLYVTCDYTGPRGRTAQCTCDYIHWLCFEPDGGA